MPFHPRLSTPPDFLFTVPTQTCVRTRKGHKRKRLLFFFWPLFVSSLYIRAFCLQLIIGVELNPNGRQREKLNQKKNKITGAVIPTEQPRWDRREMNPSWAAIPGFLFTKQVDKAYLCKLEPGCFLLFIN